MIWAPREKLCYFCIVGRYHFHHNNGDVNTDSATRGDPKCDACLTGRYHTIHDDNAFSTNGSLHNDEFGGEG